MAQIADNQNTYDGLDTSDELADLEEEEQNAAELAAEQEFYAAQTEAVDLYNQGQGFRHPSYFKYLLLLGPLAAIVDGIDIFANISGVGIPYGALISFGATVLTFLIFWFTNTKQKMADEYVENVQNKLEVITQHLASAERQVLRVARLSRHIPGSKQLYRKLHLRTIRKGRVALRGLAKSTKSPILRVAVTGALNLIPLVAVLPWQIIGIYLSYRAEKESYTNAQAASESVLESTGETAMA